MVKIINKENLPISDKKWQFEKSYYKDVYRGHEFIIARNVELGHLCGYVEVKDKNLKRLVKKHGYDARTIYELNVHGGVTYAGEVGRKVFIGFDCAHFNDFVPLLLVDGYEGSGAIENYRDAKFVRKECKNLIKQLKSLEDK